MQMTNPNAGTHAPEVCQFCEAAGLTHEDWQAVYRAHLSSTDKEQ
jgi:hypothetical protein